MKRCLLYSVLFIVCVSMVFAQDPALITGWTQQTGIYPISPDEVNPLAAQMAGVAISGDWIYVIGGNNGYDGDTSRVIRFFVNKYNGNLSPGQECTALSTAVNYCYLYEVVDTFNDYIYIGGGGYNSTGPNRNDVTYIKQISTTTGELDSAWSTSAPFPGTAPDQYDPELGGMVITDAGYLYMFGGDGEDTLTFDKCYFAKVNTDGTLGTWQTGTTLPNTWWFPGVCTINNDIIAHGGILNDKTRSNSTNKLWVCQTNPADGSMGSWVEQTNTFPVTLYNTSLVAVGNTVFAIGGRDSVNGYALDIVWRSTYDTATHTLGPWTQVDVQLPIVVMYHMAVYSPQSKSIYVLSLRNRPGADWGVVVDGALISSPLFEREVPLGAEKGWMLYQ